MLNRSPGQVWAFFAIFILVLLIVLGSGVDIASLVLQRNKLQDAADSASLAAAQTLGSGGGQSEAGAQRAAAATATQFLQQNGYRDTSGSAPSSITFPTSTPVSGGAAAPGAVVENVSVDLAGSVATTFFRLVGIQTVPLTAHSAAHAARGRYDIFLSIDETASMSNQDMDQVQRAAETFVQTLAPSADDPYSAKIAIAAFQGLRYRVSFMEPGKSTATEFALMDSLTLTNLTYSAPMLYRVIDDCATYLPLGFVPNSCPPCPTLTLDQPPMPYAVYPPLPEWDRYRASGQNPRLSELTPGYAPPASPPEVPPDMKHFGCPLRQDPGSDTSGTFIRNAFTAAFVPGGDPQHPIWNAFDVTHGGRDGTGSDAGKPPARRVLILMTDGANTIMPIPPASPTGWTGSPYARYDAVSDAQADVVTVASAAAAKDAGIEVYSIGFFDSSHNYSNMLATDPPACPSAVAPASASRDDRLLISASSSTGQSCDHYFPTQKGRGDQQLATVFATIAGRIKRAQLVE